MEVITKGNVKADGLPKIYVCGHPEDMKIYFPEIRHKLFQSGSYALYPYQEAHEKEDGFPYFLTGMQLIVVLVTERFLHTENTARGTLFRFAIDHQLPVLPLQIEPGIEQEFNRICGNIHCLDLTKDGMAAISNDKKLSDYLGNVLLDERMLRDVKNAFIGYIFLSYRQKDWKEGQALMRLIHNSPTLRDVAIWYDGFLTFGKDFNTAIFDKLHECMLFALVVTPNLLEDGNYVKRFEYPEAMNPPAPFKRKVILPVEMVPTDRAELEMAYENIPTCFQPDQTEKIARYIECNLADKVDFSKRDEPGHEYLVAMAYHSGINVEMNKDYALKLFIKAAENGSMDSAKKLVEIYRRGDGQEINYSEAIKWQNHFISGVVSMFRAEQSERSLSRVLEGLFMLLELYVEVTALEAVDQVLVTIDKWLQEWGNLLSENEHEYYRARFGLWCSRYLIKAERSNPDCDHEKMLKDIQTMLQSARQHGVSLVSKSPYERNIDLLLEIEMENGEYIASLGSFRNALAILTANLDSYRLFYEELGDEASLNKLANIYGHVAEYGHKAGDLKLALELFNRALMIFQSLCEYGELYALSASAMHTQISDVFVDCGNRADALIHLEAASNTLRGHFERTKSFSTLRVLSRCLDKIGNIYKNTGRLDEAMNFYREALSYDLERYHSEDSAGSRSDVTVRDVAVDYMKLGEVLMQTTEHQRAVDYFDDAIEWYKVSFSLADTNIGKLNSKKGIAHCINKKGQIYRNDGHLQMAVDHFLVSIRHYKELMSVSDNIDYLSSFAVINYYVGCIFLECGQREEAGEFLGTAYQAVLKQNSYAQNVRSLQLQEELERLMSL